MVRKVMPIVRAAQETVDVARAAQQFAEDAQAAQRYTEGLRTAQQFAEDARAAQQYLEDLRVAQAAAGPWPLPGRELMLAMEAGMRELLVAVRLRNVLVDAAAITGTGSIALPKMAMGGAGEVSVTADTATVTVRDDSPTDIGMPLDAKTVFLAMLWVFAILLPLKIGLLSPDVQTIIRDYLVTVGTALVIHWRVQDSRKHDLRWLLDPRRALSASDCSDCSGL